MPLGSIHVSARICWADWRSSHASYFLNWICELLLKASSHIYKSANLKHSGRGRLPLSLKRRQGRLTGGKEYFCLTRGRGRGQRRSLFAGWRRGGRRSFYLTTVTHRNWNIICAGKQSSKHNTIQFLKKQLCDNFF